MRPSSVSVALVWCLGFVVTLVAIVFFGTFWLTLLPVSDATSAPVYVRSYLYLSTGHLLSIWEDVAAPSPPPRALG